MDRDLEILIDQNNEIISYLERIKDFLSLINGESLSSNIEKILIELNNKKELLNLLNEIKNNTQNNEKLEKLIFELKNIEKNIKNDNIIKLLEDIKNNIDLSYVIDVLRKIEISGYEKNEKLINEITAIKNKINEFKIDIPDYQKYLKDIETSIKNIKTGGYSYVPSVINLKNIKEDKINPATEDNQDILAPYKIADIDDVSTIKYYGFLKANGEWYILKEDTINKTYRYTRGVGSYPTNWNNRSSLTYDYFDIIF